MVSVYVVLRGRPRSASDSVAPVVLLKVPLDVSEEWHKVVWCTLAVVRVTGGQLAEVSGVALPLPRLELHLLTLWPKDPVPPGLSTTTEARLRSYQRLRRARPRTKRARRHIATQRSAQLARFRRRRRCRGAHGHTHVISAVRELWFLSRTNHRPIRAEARLTESLGFGQRPLAQRHPGHAPVYRARHAADGASSRPSSSHLDLDRQRAPGEYPRELSFFGRPRIALMGVRRTSSYHTSRGAASVAALRYSAGSALCRKRRNSPACRDRHRPARSFQGITSPLGPCVSSQ